MQRCIQYVGCEEADLILEAQDSDDKISGARRQEIR